MSGAPPPEGQIWVDFDFSDEYDGLSDGAGRPLDDEPGLRIEDTRTGWRLGPFRPAEPGREER